MRQVMPLAPALVLACHLWRGERTDESASFAWFDFAQSFDGEARQRECAAAQFGFRWYDDLMPAHPLQTALHVQDACAQIDIRPFEPVAFFGAEPA